MYQVLWFNIPSFAAETETVTFEKPSKIYHYQSVHFYCSSHFLYAGNCKTRIKNGKIQLPITHS